jgi:hypothetical protein
MNRNSLLPILVGTGLLCTASSSIAQIPNYKAMEQGWAYGGYVSYVGLDKDIARAEGIEDSAYSFSLSGEYLYSNTWVSSLTIDFIIYDDNEEFTQLVALDYDDEVFEELFGDDVFNRDVSLESSDANAASLSAATGHLFRFGDKDRSSFLLQGGYTHFIYSERSISNCTNCRAEDIDLEGGVFIGARLAYSFDSIAFGLTGRSYISGDGLSNMVGLTITSSF